MSKRCKPAYKEKSNSANHALVICGKKCWTSTKEAMEVARAKVPKHHSALLCVWPGKLLTPKSAHAVLANADRRVRPENQAKMAAMEPTAKTVIKEARAKMPPKKKNYCRFHLNANAWPNPVHLVQLVPKAPMVHQEMPVVRAVMVNPARKAHLVHLVQLAALAKTALQVPKEKMVNWPRDPKVQPVLQVNQAKLAPPALQAKPVNQAKMVLPELLALPVMPAAQAVQAKLAAQAPQETQAKTAHPAAANTAHRLVWLQVIKRSPSRAMPRIGHQLSRLVNNHQDHYFLKKFWLIYRFSLHF